MGVTGLWRLIEPVGKPVPVETLENKVLAVDISIWLHQMVKGYQDAKGAPMPNAHLIGLFQRLCKLLYFRVKPVFVFDGGFPDLKKETIAKRRDSKAKFNSESERLKRELALILGKQTAVNALLGKHASQKRGNAVENSKNDDDIFKLPALPQREQDAESESEDDESSSGSSIDLHSINIESESFKNLSVKEKYEVLVELKETRKMNSWGRLHELPKKSDNFSDFQMQRLLKRRKVQECLEETEKEMGDTGMSINDLESFLNEEGIDTKIDSLPTRRIASNDTTRFLLIDNVKKTLAEAKMRKEAQSTTVTSVEEKPDNANNNDEEELETAIKMSLECVDEPNTKRDELQEDLEKAIKMSLDCNKEESNISKTDDSWTSVMTESDYSDSEDEDGFEQVDMSCAKSYIMQYSDFTHKVIDNIVAPKHKVKNLSKIPKADQIIDELYKEKSVIVDKVDLSSSDDELIENCNSLSNKRSPENQVDLNTSENSNTSVHNISEVDSTQSSLVCIDNPLNDVIILDTSTEEDNKITNDHIKENILTFESNKKDSSDSDDDDFEDVPEYESKPTVVQLMLNIGDDAPDDDIFADVFDNKQSTSKFIENMKDNIDSDNRNTLVTENNVKVDILSENMNSQIKEIVTNYNLDHKETLEKDKQESLNPKCKKGTIEENTDIFNKIRKDSDLIKNRETKIEENQATTNESNIPNKSPKVPISTEKLNKIAEELHDEEQDLLQKKSRLDRIGRNITEQMTKEAQELLQIFGIPYIIAPMEAEAQCAFLESVKLTDGTITDDSDIWLFGGKTVYKNFFNQKKHVLQFLAERIERSFNLNREQLILLALLVGSDYTTGITGVGPVTALEILASFPFNKKQFLNEVSDQGRYRQIITGLQEFKKWVKAGKRTDNNTLKKKLKNVDLTDDFPSIRVVQAYLEPNIEKSEEKFTWGQLDITVLRDYAKAKFGWSQNKLDEIIKPVLSRLLDRKSQRTIQDYFKRKIDFKSLENQMSKRVKAAVQRMDPDAPAEANAPKEKLKNVQKRKTGKNKEVDDIDVPGPSNIKLKKYNDEKILNDHVVKVVSNVQDGRTNFEIKIPKSDRVQEIIPQREKDKHNLLQNKMKAIELFRKTKMDPKRKVLKKKIIKPKEKADLSESSDSN